MVLPVLLCFAVAVLNGKFRAQVQAAQAQRAVLLYPYRLAVLDFDRLYRALLCAQSATDAAALNIEITRPARFQIQFIGHYADKIRRFGCSVVALLPCFDVGNQHREVFVGFFILAAHLFGVAEVEHGRPVVGHFKAERRTEINAPLPQ